ncbi:MAG: amidohydrolase [Sulfolobales archaeon]
MSLLIIFLFKSIYGFNMRGFVKGFVNGRIYASFNPRITASAMLVVGGRVSYLGDTSRVRSMARDLNGEIIDLEGGIVLPGFIDSHAHLDGIGSNLNTLDLRGVRSVRELKERVREYILKTSSKWIIGRGWDQELFEEKRWPTRWDLDEVCSERPVILTRVCGHAAVMNTRALIEAGVMDILSEDVLRDEKGEPTGIIREHILSIVKQKIRRDMDLNTLEKYLLDAMKHATSQGVTTIGFVSCDPIYLHALLSLRQKIKPLIRVRIYLSPGSDPNGRDITMLDTIRRLGIYRGFGDEYIRIQGFKIIADGSLGARTAWLSKPYSDDPRSSGYPNIEKDLLRIIAREVDRLGLQLAIHAIGDRTLDMILEIYRELGSVERKRHRIEHASLVRDDQLDILGDLKPVLVIQPRFVLGDWWALERIGVERIKWLYRFKDFIRRGIPIAISTDSPVEPLNPWETVYSAVTRGEYDNISYFEYSRDQRLSLDEALHYYTKGSAYALSDDEIGSLEEGRFADFIVVDRDPFEIDPRDLRSIRVIETYLGGERVYPEKP